jgi:ribosome-associated translation inhibitor RaiA
MNSKKLQKQENNLEVAFVATNSRIDELIKRVVSNESMLNQLILDVRQLENTLQRVKDRLENHDRLQGYCPHKEI